MKDKKTNTPFAEDGQRAHVDHKTGRCQSMKEHIENIVHFSKNICELPVLENLIILGEMLHDVGKLGMENQEDLENINYTTTVNPNLQLTIRQQVEDWH